MICKCDKEYTNDNIPTYSGIECVCGEIVRPSLPTIHTRLEFDMFVGKYFIKPENKE